MAHCSMGKGNFQFIALFCVCTCSTMHNDNRWDQDLSVDCGGEEKVGHGFLVLGS